MHKIKSSFNTFSTPPSVKIGLGCGSRGFWSFLRNSKCCRDNIITVIPNSFRNLFAVGFHKHEIPNQLCIQAHSSSLRCGGSLCKVQHDKLYNASHCKSKCAFTLAEVLITLTIIGVIAALTIPNLMKNYQTHIFKTAYKQAYSDINQAFAQAFKDGELIRTSGSQIEASTQEFEVLKKNLKVSKECARGSLFSCWAQGDTLCGGTCSGEGYDENGKEIVTTGGQPKTASFSFIDSSGRSWTQYSTDENTILVDTNGFKGPNKFGQDRFPFQPYGTNNIRTVNYKTNPPVRFGPTFPRNVTLRTWTCKFPPCYYYDWLYK